MTASTHTQARSHVAEIHSHSLVIEHHPLSLRDRLRHLGALVDSRFEPSPHQNLRDTPAFRHGEERRMALLRHVDFPYLNMCGIILL